MQVGVAEFLEKVGKLKKTEEKVAALKANDSLVLRVVLQGCYDPSIVWLLPEGAPPYKPNDLNDQESVLIRECTKLRYFVKGFHDNLPQNKREMMFIQLLENLAPKDAELLCHIKEKKPLKGITLQHVVEAFPGIIK
jgi:Family of unknown function (DUF6433)